MSTFAPLQFRSARAISSPRQHTSVLRPSRWTEPSKVSPASEAKASPDQQQVPSFSFARIPIDPPVRAPRNTVEDHRGNHTGLPDKLKAGIERLSGMALDDVRVHYNSSLPAEVQVLAYTQGTNIYVGRGQEEYLPHEAWHVVQQKQGRVRPTILTGGQSINDEQQLESEAETKGLQAYPARLPIMNSLREGVQLDNPVREGSNVIQCGRDKSKRSKKKLGTSKIRKKPPYAQPKTVILRGRYTKGQHGFKKSEQKRLATKYGITISGDTHESEHTVGFEPLNQTSGLKRGSGGRARTLENTAPAYQEVKSLHRANIGTGMHSTTDESGFTSTTYRDYQRKLIESGDVSSAVQLNQLTYAFDPNFHKLVKTPEGQVATDSFKEMVKSLKKLTYAQGDTDVAVTINERQQAEMIAARAQIELGRQLTPEEIAAIYQEVNIDKYWE